MITPVPGKPNLLLGAYDLATLGYGAQEFFVSGTASSYAVDERADYTTRIVVLTPTDQDTFNGTVIVEWLNVSGGIDAPAVWFMGHREIAREGYAYVAVSAQRVGVEGGDSLLGANMSLKAQDPERYSKLKHPGDAFAYDIYSQVGSLIRSGSIDGLNPQAVLAVGESQSAMFLTTYVNEVDPREPDVVPVRLRRGFRRGLPVPAVPRRFGGIPRTIHRGARPRNRLRVHPACGSRRDPRARRGDLPELDAQLTAVQLTSTSGVHP